MTAGAGRVGEADRAGGPADLSRYASQPTGAHPYRGGRTNIHLIVNDRLVGEVIAERRRRDRIDPCWRSNLIGSAA